MFDIETPHFVVVTLCMKHRIESIEYILLPVMGKFILQGERCEFIIYGIIEVDFLSDLTIIFLTNSTKVLKKSASLKQLDHS